MKLHISYNVGMFGVLDGQTESALIEMVTDYDGEWVSSDWTVLCGTVYKQLFFDVPGSLAAGDAPGRFCRQACEHLRHQGLHEPKFGLAKGVT